MTSDVPAGDYHSRRRDADLDEWADRYAKLERDLAAARAKAARWKEQGKVAFDRAIELQAEVARLRDFVDAAKNILQSVEKASPVEIRAWLAALEKTR